jgi:OOP family OmpA-OmpF porin
MMNSKRSLIFCSAVAVAFLGGCTCYQDEPAPEPAPAPVAAAAPAPAPAQCADEDADGVCDADDQCPETKPGTRVGSAGCDCDYALTTHFAFDSAELTAEDKAELDRLVEVLMNPKLSFTAGEIHGHTDSIGSDAYNVKLSQRRADAIASYLQSKGLQTSDRLVTRGYGEESPVADNATKEGQAQNRRAVIRRTDCGPAN